MLRIAICDDEQYFRDKLKNMTEEYLEGKNIVYETDVFESGVELVKDEEKLARYDMIFLDINMKDIDGIETARLIRRNMADVFIIFVTAYISYSPEGYKVNAIRYLLKGDVNFAQAFTECMDTVLKLLDDRRLSVKFNFREGVREVLLDSIVYIESNLHRLTVHVSCKDGVFCDYTTYDRLDLVAEKITSDKFVRIHKSYLVNLKYVTDFTGDEAILVDGRRLSVSKPRRKEMETRYILSKGAI